MNLWNTISYRVRICKTQPQEINNNISSMYQLYLYRIDGSKSISTFATIYQNSDNSPSFATALPEKIEKSIWAFFSKRLEKIMTTMILSLKSLKRKVDCISSNLVKYKDGTIDFAQLLQFEENNIVATIEIICQLYTNKDKYDFSKTFNQNLTAIFHVESESLKKTQESKNNFVKFLLEKDKEDTLYEYIYNGIDFFNAIYKCETDKCN